MGRRRRSFSPEYKSEVVNLVREGGKSIGQVCRELDLTESAVRNWVRQAEIDEKGGGDGHLATVEREELAKLR